MRRILLVLAGAVCCGQLQAQVKIGPAAGAPHASAAFEVESTSKGALIPRMTSAQRDAISGPATGLMVYCTDLNTLSFYNGSYWETVGKSTVVGSVIGLTCNTPSGNFLAGEAISGTFTVDYTGGNGGVYPIQSLPSTGVTGLTATAATGNLANGSGSITYSFSGTPVSGGTASFAINLGGQSCATTKSIGALSSLTQGATTGNLAATQAASGVSIAVNYTGGNSAPYAQKTATSSGVTGLTATLAAGTLASGSGSLTYIITGTPATTGTASFAVSIGGQSATLTATVLPSLPAALGSTFTTAHGSNVAAFSTQGTCTSKLVSAGHSTFSCKDSVTIGSNSYTMTLVYGQCWMARNMNEVPSSYNPPPTYVTSTDNGWTGAATGGGLYYQWSAFMNGSSTERAQGVCPTDWHVPSDCEWMYLEHGLGLSVSEQNISGFGFIRPGGNNFNSPNAASGFALVNSGLRTSSGSYQYGNSENYLASSTSDATTYTGRRIITWNNQLRRPSHVKAEATVLRCLKD